MIVDINQKPTEGIIEVSYVTEDGGIDLKKYNVHNTNGVGFYDYEICDEGDPQKELNLRHYKDNLPIRKRYSKKFDYDEEREFILKSLPESETSELLAMRSPKMYAADIEINIEDGEVFPDPHKADFEIDSIQITSPNLNTVVLTTNKRAISPTIDDTQVLEIEQRLNDHYKDIDYVWSLTEKLEYSHIIFESEAEMLKYWWLCINKKLHYVTFWYGEEFDVPYLSNRSKKFGIDVGMGSPTGKAQEFRTRNKDKSMTSYFWPAHRLVTDYMKIVDVNAYDIDKQSLSLDYIANRTLGIGKVSYEGGFADLYKGEIERYMTYGAVDTVSLMLIHLNRNYSAGLESLAYYCKCPLTQISKTTVQVHSVIWDELYNVGLINASPYEKKHKTKYEGGYVKEPIRKFAMYPAGIDFSALYPRIVQSHNMSFENFMGKVKDKADMKAKLAQGHYVSVNGNWYKNEKDYCLKRVLNKLLDERYAYKGYMLDIYNGPIPTIEQELERRRNIK